jgi:hypothetical protein
VPILRAQGYPPGFDISIEWEHFEEQSKDKREVDASQLGARIAYSMPQTFDVFVALSRENIDAWLDSNDVDLDPALAFRVGGKLYALRAIPIGVPADLTLSFSYSTAKHEAAQTKRDYTHRRIIATCGLEWRYVRSTPYMKLGILSSELDTPREDFSEDFDQTSLLIAAGVYAPLVDNIFFRAEINVCQEIGYAVGVQYRF